MHVLKREKTLCAQLVSYTHAMLFEKFNLSSLDGIVAEWLDRPPNSKILLYVYHRIGMDNDSAKTALEISVRNNMVSIRI